jgi:hypothetical protein
MNIYWAFKILKQPTLSLANSLFNWIRNRGSICCISISSHRTQNVVGAAVDVTEWRAMQISPFAMYCNAESVTLAGIIFHLQLLYARQQWKPKRATHSMTQPIESKRQLC